MARISSGSSDGGNWAERLGADDGVAGRKCGARRAGVPAVTVLLKVLLREKVVPVGMHQASIALLMRHHSYQHLPCWMTENQGLVVTTFGVSVRRVAVCDATSDELDLGQASM